MCKLLTPRRFKKNDSVHLTGTSYLRYWQNHNSIDGLISGVIDNVHNKYFPEYEIRTPEGTLIVPEYSIQKNQKSSHKLSEKIFSTSTGSAPKEVLLF
ncbi:hypothetical protein WOSG25_110770 [Weissella oryzae SG25]|uniref:Uncharacterized protein n=1 Tax=Weissella oryzae (strain DSM 25784 / JCM 18191 / LMG 30913 / SG25) TaxID=1329250 RepID=A0A069CVU2_WEIOS|nr:hypothetical protein [Weissella oryzae]GAK31599.1 hypothetical protein WOSG25_110770 [Weissella oryzae SG25]